MTPVGSAVRTKLPIAGEDSQSSPHASSTSVDVRGLEEALRNTVQGEVRFDAGSRAIYATDASNYRQPPIGVVIPRDADDIVNTVAACRHFGAPVLSRGGGTSLAGQCCNIAVVMDMSKYYNRLIELDPDRRIARVQPGIVLDALRDETEKHHLTFGPDPATHRTCCIGGMMGNNSCGVHSMMAGRTSDNVEEIEILTYDGLRMRVGAASEGELENIIRAGNNQGKIYARLRELRDRLADPIRQRYPKIPRRVSGYNLDELLPESGFHVARSLVGTEGTCVVYLEATLRLIHSPPHRVLAVLGYPDVYAAADALGDILPHEPIGLEGVDDQLVLMMRRKALHTDDIELLPSGNSWLLVEFGGDTPAQAADRARGLLADLQKHPHPPSHRLAIDAHEQHRMWRVRESGLGASAFVPGKPDTWEGWEDSAVAPEKLGSYLRGLRTLMNEYGYAGPLYGHFGQGCVHTRMNFDLQTAEGIRNYRSFAERAADLVMAHGGSLSGEHGDGQSRAEFLPKMFGAELVEGFREFKHIWDPHNRMNPGKVVDAYRLDENLRLGAGYYPPQLHTHFTFPDDQGSFARATLRCVGVGKCRQGEAETMCPSYRVTRDEKHTTRGRAHALFEMLQGDIVQNGWRDEHVKETLDLCLSCKGCKHDCPVHVDIATYKAEFLSHYYERRLRPRHAYAFGWIFRWARLASHAPGLVNFFTQTPGLTHLAKWAADIAPKRRIPRFARQSFKQWFTTRHNRQGTARSADQLNRRVLLWPDTFTNYFQPHIARAATEVLEAAGFTVEVPSQSLCCGRPLYDYGMLAQAKHQLQEITEALKGSLQAGVPIVVLEPSCLAVFHDEAVSLLPECQEARLLRQNSFTLAQFLEKHAPDRLRGKLHNRLLLHGHCHQKALLSIQPELQILKAVGAQTEFLDAGCCGMAGAFGFEPNHYDVSIACGERVLLPAVRAADPDTLMVADGFSCREQVSQCTNRQAFHLAEVLHRAMNGESRGA